eukprot:scaffold8416_cov267-Pinguiococcus_pyrenoidosus.AAC.4
MTGASQVSAKAFTTLALAKGVAFPVLMLAKSAKMVPVMIGSILLGGAREGLTRVDFGPGGGDHRRHLHGEHGQEEEEGLCRVDARPSLHHDLLGLRRRHRRRPEEAEERRQGEG